MEDLKKEQEEVVFLQGKHNNLKQQLRGNDKILQQFNFKKDFQSMKKYETHIKELKE